MVDTMPINRISSRTTLSMLLDRLFWIKRQGSGSSELGNERQPFPYPRLINNPSHDPVSVIRHIDQQPREIHTGQLGTNFVFSEGSEQ